MTKDLEIDCNKLSGKNDTIPQDVQGCRKPDRWLTAVMI